MAAAQKVGYSRAPSSLEVVEHIEDIGIPLDLTSELVEEMEEVEIVEEDDEDERRRYLYGIGDDKDYDFVLTTSAEPGEVSASHSFESSNSSVVVRYRFVVPKVLHENVTSAKSNDYFRISIRSSGGSERYTNTDSFDYWVGIRYVS
jgi:hypothetical protein